MKLSKATYSGKEKIFERGREKERLKTLESFRMIRAFVLLNYPQNIPKFKALINWFSSSYNKTHFTHIHTQNNQRNFSFPKDFYSNKNSIYFSIMAKAFHFPSNVNSTVGIAEEEGTEKFLASHLKSEWDT